MKTMYKTDVIKVIPIKTDTKSRIFVHIKYAVLASPSPLAAAFFA